MNTVRTFFSSNNKTKKLIMLCLLIFSVSTFAQYPRASMWTADMNSFAAMDVANGARKDVVLFIGSSTFKMWTSLETDFPDSDVLNRSFGGSMMIDLIYYFNRVVAPYNPRQVVIYEGDNDLYGTNKTAEEFMDDVISIIRLINIYFPSAEITLISIKPSPSRSESFPKYLTANNLMKNYAEKHSFISYVNTWSPMLKQDGTPETSYFGSDMLHMNTTGYTLWKTILKPYLLTPILEVSDETYAPAKVKPILDEWQKKSFQFFYLGASPTGLALEGNERGDVITIGGTGFGLMALIVGAERSFINRDQATQRTIKIIKFLGKAERFKGVWAHWYNPDGTSHPFGDQVKTGDLVETSFVMAGLIAAKEYYDNNNVIEKEIRDSVDSFINSVDWKFYASSGQYLHWLWYSQTNKFELPIRGWNESLITYILALAAPAPHNISAEVYNKGWLNNGLSVYPSRNFYGYSLPLGEDYGGPLFFSHYSFLGLNPFVMHDKYVDYWKQNTAHTLINRHYCVYEAPKRFKYDEQNWGLSACYGGRPPWNYMARSPRNDDGVIAPTAALSSYPYTPFYSTQMLFQLDENALIKGSYGFADAYSPETSTSEKKHLAIDQGPIVVMIENYRTGLIWNLLMKNTDIKNGLSLAGISTTQTQSEGFNKAIINTQTKEFDIMRHPDRGVFELDYFILQGGSTHFQMKNINNKIVMDTTFNAVTGQNSLKFSNSSKIVISKQYTIKLKTSTNTEYSLVLRLR